MLKRNRSVQSRKKKKGQSTVEYIILIAAIIAALVAFLRPGGVFQSAYNSAITEASGGMEEMANRLRRSRPADNGA